MNYTRIPDAETAGQWLENAIESVDYLKLVLTGDWIPIYVSGPFFYVFAVLMKAEKANPVDHAKLGPVVIDPSSSWRLEHVWGGGEPERMYLEAGIGESGGSPLACGQQLMYRRRMYGLDPYIELDQRLVQALDVHFLSERNAYCRVNRRGDIEPIIKVEQLPADESGHRGTLVSVKTEDLVKYMVVTQTVLAAKFDFTRVDHKKVGFDGWQDAERQSFTAPNLAYHSGRIPGRSSFVNGWIIVRPNKTLAEVIEDENTASDRSKRQYADFIIQDARYGRIITCSAAPEASTNYFDATEGLPFELSPVFFRPEVMSKYKADTDKYQIDGRMIRCRNAWELRSFDINEAGQVHTYLQDLSHLPYEEQLYWKSFNEEPKAPISKRSFTSDFLGQWTNEPDPLDELKRDTASLDGSRPPWWIPRGEAVRLAAQYPSQDNAAEWGQEIMHLDQLVVEGFKESELRKIAANCGAQMGTNWRSLRLIETIFVASGVPEGKAKAMIAPLQRMHALRSTLTAHTGGTTKAEEKRKAIAEHQTYRAHFENLAGGVHDGLTAIIAVLNGDPTTPPEDE
ncbi:hypothetical protein [Mesorhizobium sp. M00.F.Ca.ET.217.01.1.1]|uniref:hypothetical protein n=1 Tax=Mesorhizobium sp. M00.F.Ca.ET.217.01.1.1 TaxID=2500529 RepID=UPI000FD7A1D4|nr:hypothetical protein [Mesorhizobium sp. M00.F.Ca.ET.217.01.1.1]TGV94503.1 hypothetical protein EN801_002410 [Mesorhizobium sp. M00.F.Ca.ET.158.01.1.1]